MHCYNAQGNSLKFHTGLVLVMVKVSNTVLGLYPSSRDCMKRNKPEYVIKFKMVDHTVAMSCSFVNSQPLIYSKNFSNLCS